MILLINSIHKQCGVYQYGLRLYIQLNRPDLFEYIEIGSNEEFVKRVHTNKYDACILNYHPALFGWWIHCPNTFYLYHENIFPYDIKYILNTDPTHALGIPRPIYQTNVIPSDPVIPTFGSFGFGFENKGYERIIDTVQNQYDIAVIRLLIPYAHYGDRDGGQAKRCVDSCMTRILKPGIKLTVIHEFLSNDEVVRFLASNTLNLFLYDPMPGRGCSSVIDYALASNKPIAISDSHMFRHIYSDAICAYKRPLKDIIAEGTRHIEVFQKKWNSKTLCEALLGRIHDVA